ncbi:MAG: hypothetical protein JWQ27_746 [Ferruginibacter sp.]|nr:hypothetical protein [Ferruginibacter sp.]
MKTFIACLLALISPILFVSNLFSQSVAINNDGTTPHSSALLDIKSTTKGLLPPRMNSTQRMNIATPAAGLFVYDTDTNTYWFYNGTGWTNLASSGTFGWLLTGNNATNPATHYLGTSDNQPLRFKVNNVWAGEIHSSNGNIFLGLNSGLNSIGILNSAFGAAALKSNTSGSENVAIGDSSLYSQTGNATNVAVGTHSLFSNTTGTANTALGPYALFKNADGGFNTSLGVNTLSNNISGNENTAIGSRALQFNMGSQNTATGSSALRFNSIGANNTANGYNALYSNIAGQVNAAFGMEALYSNTAGQANVAFGVDALFSNTTASENTAVGTYALDNQNFNNGGSVYFSANTAIGCRALLYNNPTSALNGINNTAIGHSALQFNSTGRSNTGTGYVALFSNTTGDFNTAHGVSSLYQNTTGQANTGVGTGALSSNTIGSFNTAVGTNALVASTTGGDNIGIGYSALSYLVTGSGNIAIGDNSGTASGSPGISNTISIGNAGFLNAASNQAFIGNMSTGFIGGHVAWATYSDARIKKNITEEVKGLDFIMRLRPVTYNKSLAQMRAITGDTDTKDFEGKYDVEKIKNSGFLAQEVEKAANASGYDFEGIHKPKNEHDLYSLSYALFVVPLVKAMQEQQAIIKMQQQQIDLLINRVTTLEKK